MHGINNGRSLQKQPRRVKAASVLASYAELHRGLPCEWCWAEGRLRVPWTDIHHIIGGHAGREDADWNIVCICKRHHQDEKVGFHGSQPLWDHRRAFLRKLKQGLILPKAAWSFLPQGYDAGPMEHPDQEANRLVTVQICDDLRMEIECG
jgi:hypothetical protein